MQTEQQKAFDKILSLIEDAGCAEHLILVGSWVEFAYENAGYIEGFCSNLRTRDVDFLVRNLRRPSPAASLSALAREQGYLIESDRLNGTTKIFDSKTGLEVEFLIGKVGAGREPSLRTNVGVTAQALRHLDILSGNTVSLECLGHIVTVPTPEAYVVHKMVINEERGAKAEKDAAAIEHLIAFLDSEKLEAVLRGLSKKERARVETFIARRGLESKF